MHTFALRGALDNAGKIQQLDLGLIVMDDAGDAGERGELIGRNLRLGAGQDCENCGLPHRRKA